MKKEKQHIFEQEEIILKRARSILERQNANPDGLLPDYQALAESYEQLLGEVRLLTSVSDRFQLKLNKATESIERKNQELQKALQTAANDRANKETSYLLLGIIIFLFLISEAFLDPYWLKSFPENATVGLFLLKLGFLLLIFPLKNYIKKILLKTIRQ